MSSRKKEEVSTEEQLLEVLVDNKDEEDAEEEEDAVEEEDAEEVEPQRLKFWFRNFSVSRLLSIFLRVSVSENLVSEKSLDFGEFGLRKKRLGFGFGKFGLG